MEEFGNRTSENVGKFPTMMGGELMILDVNRRILNLLTTVRTFLDLTERRLKHRYGSDSDRVSAFRLQTAGAFDTSFSYRFLYKLRNFVQHCGLPVGRMTIKARTPEEGAQSISQSLDIEFDRDLLLGTFDSWGGKVKADLKAMPVSFPIRPHIEEMMALIEKLQLAQTAADGPALLDSLDWLDGLSLEASWRGGDPAVGFERPDPQVEGDLLISLAHFPLEMMRLLRNPAHRIFGVGTARFFT